ncbi:pyridoxal-phosphate dependent enzyme [Candidatus Acidianus copahuensis]|uniref:Cysteine synthase n=1 Tax=Candidatus Acidianus copahuensis TaxID=1160895 RepID=A0A031LQ94_9CREN|nr:pyridoxal-phosphate dependent enzyme [Candidatus Acidianus copahuensis]EZQ06895.1 cysteine synthase [Candidatus Acidianus copahuensis]NON61390.1 pyridoxal-phosphate dependent enzyme [Acidianus sp. RZ1]
MSRDLHVFEDPISLLEDMWPTPILRLKIGKDVWGKLEFFNPFSRSIKDRTAWFLFREALKSDSKEIVEATSGNLGIALSSFSSIFEKKASIFIPSSAPLTFKAAMRILGTNVVEMGGSTSELVPLVKMYSKNSGAYHPDQFNNELNYMAHYYTTAKEIDDQINSLGKIPERIIATAGTGGHLAGISKFFKEKYGNKVEIVGVQPAEGERIPGIKRQDGKGLISHAEIDIMIDITTREAMDGVIAIARTSGIIIGISSGATVAAYKKFLDDKTTVLVFPDDGFKYIVDGLVNEK